MAATSSAHWMTPAASAVAAVMGLLALLGYLLDVSLLRSFLAGGADAGVPSVAAVLLSAVALVLLTSRWPPAHVVAKVLAVAVGVLGGLSLLQYLTGDTLGLDPFLLVDVPLGRAQVGTTRLSPLTAATFLVLSGGLLAMDRAVQHRVTPAEAAALISLVPAILMVAAHGSGAEVFPQVTQMALPTALGLAALATALFSARPSRGFAAVVFGRGEAGVLARRVLPSAIAITLAASWVYGRAVERGFIEGPLRAALLATVAILLFTAVTVRSVLDLDHSERERERAVEDLARSEMFLREVMDGAGDAIVVKDRDLRFVLVNQVAADFLGLEREEVLGRRLLDLQPELTDVEEQDRRVLQDGRPRTQEVDFEVGGDDRTLFLTKTPCRDREGGIAGVIIIAHDITERKRMEVDLERTVEELRRFTGIAAHDLQEPLRKIQTFGSVLDRTHGRELGDEGRAALDRMTEAAGHLSRLVTDLLQYASLEESPASTGTVDLAEALNEALESLSSTVTATNADVTVDDLPAVEGDPQQMRDLFHNLLDNALKYRRPGVTPQVRVAAVVDDEVRVRVEDNGIGFDPRYGDRIFEPFKRLHGRYDYPGTGMGLAIVRKIVERHHGHVEVASRPGEGSVFTVVLPRPAGERGAGTA